jgi:hypothetical protein
MGVSMSSTAQTQAVKNYRQRLGQRGMARFEVMGLIADRTLIRTLARRLAEDNTDTGRNFRATLCRSVAGESASTGGILAALRRSPLVGADINFAREETAGRAVDL